MDTASNPGWQTSEFATMIICNIVAVCLAKGWITASEAQAVQNNAPQIGAVILFILGNVGYIFSRTVLKLRFGPKAKAQSSQSQASQTPSIAPQPVTVPPAAPTYATGANGTTPDTNSSI